MINRILQWWYQTPTLGSSSWYGLDDAPSAEPEIKAKRKGHVAFVTNDIADENVGSSVGTALLDAE
jgi:hypothetical protein